MKLNPEELSYLFDLIKKKSGIHLTEDKGYLVDSRLMPVVKKHHLSTIANLVAKLKKTNDEKIITEVIEAMTTNESSFFRDITPFEKLNSLVVPRIKEKNPGKTKIRIWCAACSTGQEPYTIAINIKEKLQSLNLQFEIVASDIATHVLDKAKQGIYTQFEVQRGLPINLLLKYFKQVDKSWHIKEDIRSMVEFKKVNLIEDNTALGKFDIIFCRNVLIYFNTETKFAVINNLSKLLEPSGVLFLGASESIIGAETKFKLLEEKANGIFVVV